MKPEKMLTLLAACAVAAIAAAPVTGTSPIAKAHAQEAAKTYKSKGAEGRSAELRRGGYYSYGAADSNPKIDPHLAPMVGLQSPAGPFDSGFYFDSGLTPHWWNNAPYPN